VPPPDLSPAEYRDCVTKIVDDLVKEERARRRREGRKVLGVEAILSQDPRRAPERTSRSPAPICHASRREVRKAYREALRTFQEVFKDCSERLRLFGELTVTFPDYCFPPSRGFVRPNPKQ